MKKEIIIIKDNLISSIIQDIVSFTILLFCMWFNYKFIGGSYIINAIILLWILGFILRFTKDDRKTFYSLEELDEYVKKLKSKQIIYLNKLSNKSDLEN